MAYLADIKHTCDARDCTERATVRLCTSRHLAVGDYCLGHGDERLRELQEHEDRACRPPKTMPPLVTR